MAAGPAGPARQRVPAFWGYSVAARAMGPAAALLEGARLPLVLDLDETLLAAFALGQLEARLEAARAAHRAAIEAATSASAAQRCARPRMVRPCVVCGLSRRCLDVVFDLFPESLRHSDALRFAHSAARCHANRRSRRRPEVWPLVSLAIKSPCRPCRA